MFLLNIEIVTAVRFESSIFLNASTFYQNFKHSLRFIDTCNIVKYIAINRFVQYNHRYNHR